MFFYSVRGAITVEKNDTEEILSATEDLLKEMIDRNKVELDNITQIIFSATKDITKVYPAVAARNIGITNASLFCVQEMYVEGSLPLCIRVLMNFVGEEDKKISHVYLKGAKILRPDISGF